MNPLLRILVKAGLLPKGFSESDNSLAEPTTVRQLSRRGVLNEREALKVIASHCGVEVMNLESQQIVERLETGGLLKSVDSSHLITHRCVPLWVDQQNQELLIAFANPLDLEAQKSMRFIFQRKITPIVAAEDQILRLLEKHLDTTDYEDLVINTFGEQIEIIRDPGDAENLIDSRVSAHIANTPNVVKLCDKMITEAVRLNASDIHIEPNEGGLEIRCRIDGVMQHLMDLSKRYQHNVVSRFKLLAKMDIAEKRRPQDGRFPARILGEVVDLRVSSIPVSFGEKIVMRLLRTSADELSFDTLGFPKDIITKIKKSLGSSGKMILVTGPTGSGKTTTLYTCLNQLRDGTKNIQTVEDPVEYQIPGIHQTQVNEQAGVSFASALRSILRQDPDVIMIGEIRDRPTAEIAVQAAQTGHLVLSTLHTNTAIDAISRLLHLGVEPQILGQALAAILAQRLVRMLCTDCATIATPEYLAEHQEILDRFNLGGGTLLMEQGCPKCGYSGFRGRTSVVSLLEMSSDIGTLVHGSASPEAILKAALRNGFTSLSEGGIQLIRTGESSLGEVKRTLPVADIDLESLNGKPEEPEKKGGAEVMTEEGDKPAGKSRKKRTGQKSAVPEDPSSHYKPEQQGTQPPPPYPGYQVTPQHPTHMPPGQYPPGHYPPGYGPPPSPFGMPQPYPPYYNQPYQQPPVIPPQYPPPGFPPGYPQYGAPQHPPQVYVVQPNKHEAEQRAEPRIKGKVSKSRSKPANSKPSAIQKRPKKVKVVLVEDNPDIRLLMKTVLENESFEVIDVENGREALDAVYKHVPQAIVCDLMMPVMDGRKFLQSMKGNPETESIPIVILTASDPREHEADLLELGAADFVNKSAPTDVMLARLRKSLKEATREG